MPKKLRNKRILVLGGTGFIGSHLVKKLQEKGLTVNLLVYDKIPKTLPKKNITIFKGDISNKKTLVKAVKNSDIIVNLVGTFNKEIYYLLNVASSANLMDVCRENRNIEKVIFISSEAVYGDYRGRSHTEKDTPRPVTEYGFSKYLAEEIYKFYSKKYKIPVIILRLANTYGPGNKIGVISECLNFVLKNRPVEIHKDGKQRRDFLYVDDAVNGIINSISYNPKGFDVFNISGNKAYSLLEMISLIGGAVNRKIKIKFMAPKAQDIKCMSESWKKSKTVLGYSPRINLKEGITLTVDYKKIASKNRILSFR